MTTPAPAAPAPRYPRLRMVAIVAGIILAAPILLIVLVARLQGSTGR